MRALAAVVLTGMALAGASPVQADEHKVPEVLEGVYTVNFDGQGAAEWGISPSCVPTVGDLREPLYLPVACRLNVTQTGRPGASARQVGFRWTFQYDEENTRTCPDGSKAPQTEIYSFDGNTLVGTLKVIHGEVCGEQPGMTTIPFTLTYKGPLSMPVDRYPLYCEPAGLRICQ